MKATNAALTGEVMLAALLRFFAAKVTILLNPFERLVIRLLLEEPMHSKDLSQKYMYLQRQ
jgi:hypothetical protein